MLKRRRRKIHLFSEPSGEFTDRKQRLEQKRKLSGASENNCIVYYLEGVDGLLLETYYDFDELTTVLQIAREETDLPIITNVSMHEAGVLQNGIELADALQQLEDLGADVVGINCRLGPHHMLKSLESVPLPKRALLAVYPNASFPGYEDGKLFYENNLNTLKNMHLISEMKELV